MWPESDLRLLDRTLKRLRTALPDLPEPEKAEEDDLVLRLPVAAGADYFFRFTFHGPAHGGGRLIDAALPAQPVDRRGRPSMFWHCSIEPTTPPREALADAFDTFALTLVCSPTRIVQSRGLLFWKFVLHSQSPDGSWQRQNSVLASRLGYTAPPIVGRQHVYSAPALGTVRGILPG